MKKSLVFVGAFNPPTKAHIELANEVREYLQFDSVIFVPSKMDYIRFDQKKDFVFSDEDRLRFLKTIAKHHKWMRVSSYELRRKRQPKTWNTLNTLERQTGNELKLLVGSDKIKELETNWRYVEEICKKYGIVAMARKSDNLEEIIRKDSYLISLNAYITVVKTNPNYKMISSSEVRKRLQQGKSIRSYVPEEIISELEEMRGRL